MRKHKLNIFGIALLFLNGCSNTGSGGSGTGTIIDEEKNPVRLDQLGVLPASNSSASSYLLQLTNYSKDKYTLGSVRVIDLDNGKDSKLVSVASQACSTVSANGSCSLQLTPHTSQSADVKLEVNLKDKLGASTKLVQLIRVSSELSSNNGGIVMLNDIDRIVTEDGNYSLSIPVLLGDSYDNIKASNGSLICNTPGYQKGSSCTYQVRGKVSSNTGLISTRLEGIKSGKVVTIQEANTKIGVGKGAYLLLSHGTKINYPESSAEITLFNSGNSQATAIKSMVDGSSGLEIDGSASNCATDLAANESCKIKVNVVSTSNGEGALRVTYKDNKTTAATLTNIRYTVEDATAGITFNEESSNNLLNAIVGGKVRSAQIKIKNTGNRPLEDGIRYYLAPSTPGFSLKSPTENGCDLSGKALASAEECNLTIEYRPAAAFVGEKTINLVVNAKSIDQNGQSHALVKAYGLNYSALAITEAPLQFSKAEGPDKLSILANNQDTAEATWILKNTISYDENLFASNVNVVLDPANIAALSITPVDSVACGANTQITGNASCRYKVKYGATDTQQTTTPVDLKASYVLNQQNLMTKERFEVEATPLSTTNPKITAEVTKTSDPAGITGDGTQDNPWSFIASSQATPLILEYKFTNTGSVAAKFNVDSGNLPNGAIVAAGSDCPLGTQTSDLDPTASCTVNISIPDPELFNIPNLPNNRLNGASLEINLPYSYQDRSGSIISNDDNASKRHVQFSRLWTNVEHEISDIRPTESAYEFTVISRVAPTKGIFYPITITPTLKYLIDGVTFSTCTIVKSQNSCVNTISLPKDKFITDEKLQVTFKTSANGLADNDAIISEFPVGATIVAMRNQSELVAAFNSLEVKNSTSAKLFILENDIALTEPWIPVQELKNVVIDGQGHKITNLQIECTERGKACGMFKYLYGNVIIRNLSLQGKVNVGINKSGGLGLLAGRTKGKNSNFEIYNSNFNSEIIGSADVGGVIGEFYGSGTFESITIFSKIDGLGSIGSFCGFMTPNDGKSITFKNMRITSTFKNIFNTSGEAFGGLIGYVLGSNIGTKVENTILDIELNNAPGIKFQGSLAGGLFGQISSDSFLLNISKVDVNFKTSGFSEATYGLLGRKSGGKRVWKIELSDIISRGKISTSADPQVAANRIAGITIPELGSFTLNNLVDMSTISYNGQNYVSPLVGKHPTLNSPGNHIYYVLPEGTTYIAGLNSLWPVEQLTGNTAAAQKSFLVGKDFDFADTWTIKKINGVDSIGINEDSIPQFPTW